MNHVSVTARPIIPALENYYEKFLKYLDISENSARTYMNGIKAFAEWMEAAGIDAPSREDILEYKAYLERTRKDTTVQTYIAVLKVFFGWLETEGLYPNIARHIKAAADTEYHRKDFFTGEQVAIVLDSMPKKTELDLRNYALLLLLFTGGLRTVEAARARIKDMQTAGGKSVLFIQGKGQKAAEKFVNLTSQAEKAIRKYLQVRQPESEEEPLFSSGSNRNRGQGMTTRSISRLVKETFKKAGFDSERLTAHSTRHTAITLALMGGEKLQDVQQFARHKSINTTLRYAHDINRLESTCEASIEKAIFKGELVHVCDVKIEE